MYLPTSLISVLEKTIGIGGVNSVFFDELRLMLFNREKSVDVSLSINDIVLLMSILKMGK